jgi:hypothetical protein
MTEETLQLNSDEILDRGRNAELLLNNPTLSEILEVMLRETSMAFMASAPEEHEAREALYHHSQAIMGLREMIRERLNTAVAEAGKLARQSRKH